MSLACVIAHILLTCFTVESSDLCYWPVSLHTYCSPVLLWNLLTCAITESAELCYYEISRPRLLWNLVTCDIMDAADFVIKDSTNLGCYSCCMRM